uniref:hypoxia-inducible factor-proline dioxygenase n=1 Tax=Syphacia muris TaxID=451379 RepID=A0A158R477_9BILA
MGASTQKKGCAFCGALAATDGGPLAPCKNCKMAAYCGEEHQNYDWKRHKIFCKAIQSKNATTTQNRCMLNKKTENGCTTENLCRNSRMPESSGQTFIASTSSLNSNRLLASCSSSSSTSNFLSLQVLSLGLVKHSDNSVLGLRRALDACTRNKMNSSGDSDSVIESNNSRLSRMMRKRPRQLPRQIKDHRLNRPYCVDIFDHISLLLKSSVASTLYDAMALRIKYIADHVVKHLNEFGWAIVDSFFGSPHCRQALAEMETLYDYGLFSPGQLLVKKSIVQAQDVRTDEIFWFDAEDERLANASSLRLLVSTIDSVAAHFKDRVCSYNICSRAKPMIALFPANGARYVRHVDNPAGDGRCITSIYYCNEHWDTEKDGGAFRIYPKTSTTPITINPKADRLLFFFSGRQNPHEVLPTFRKRYAMTIWYYDRNERNEMESRRLPKSHNIDCISNFPAEDCSTRKSESLSNDSVEIREPPTKWKKAKEWVSSEASEDHNQPSSASVNDALMFLRDSSQISNRRLNEGKLLTQCCPTFALPFQVPARDSNSLGPALRCSLKGKF